MDDEDSDDYVDVEVSGTLSFYRTTRMPRVEAEKIVGLYGFDLREAVDRELVINSTDITGIEDVESFRILEKDSEGEEE